MILLRPDCLVFETAAGEHIPCAAKEVTFELVGEAAKWLDAETIENAAAAVLHYFRKERKQESVSVAQFASALEKVFVELGLEVKMSVPLAPTASTAPPSRPLVEADLRGFAGDGGELFLFPRLREEVRRRLDGTPRVLRFHGLRDCVKQITGAKRWGAQCRALNDQIVDYLRTCFSTEKAGTGSALVVL
jgi:hypothetical protein